MIFSQATGGIEINLTMNKTIIQIVISITVILLGCQCGFRGKRVLSEAVSPNGKWSVSVTGNSIWSGAVEVGASTGTPQGQTVSHGVIDLCEDWKTARQRYSTIKIDNKQAVVHKSTIPAPPLTSP